MGYNLLWLFTVLHAFLPLIVVVFFLLVPCDGCNLGHRPESGCSCLYRIGSHKIQLLKESFDRFESFLDSFQMANFE
jgi:hypothetical protein